MTETTSRESLVRSDLARIADCFDAATQRAKRAATIPDREAAEAERRDAAGEFWAAESDLAHLFLLLLRITLRHQPEALLLYLADALRPELIPIVETLATLEARK